MFCLVPYNGTYLMLLNRIRTIYITEVIGNYLISVGNPLWNGDFVMSS